MERSDQLDDLINKALSLAYFIHGNKALAIEIVASALSKLEVAVQAQDKRLYYEPQGRATTRRARNKISFGEKHLLQRLIYIESEPFEKQKERSGTLDEEDMITHFIKHLIKITLKRNSFYVSLGISRLLHNYSTAETMEIYNLVIQDPERVRDDYYYRSRKGRLMQEVKERFGSLLRVTKVNRGEERFETNGQSAQYAGFVLDCLDNFTPWATACVIPTSFNPLSQSVQDLAFDSQDPDAEHRVEVNRTHSIMHPDCFTRLIKALKLNPPNERLEIPNFFLSERNETHHRNEPPGFGQDDIDAIKAKLNEQSSQRKRFASGLLKVVVDGVEMAEIDLQHTSHAQFQLDEDAELIEVFGKTKASDLLLATCFVSDSRNLNSKRTITLEGGQEITFNLAQKADRYGEIEETAVEIGYRETQALKAATLALQQGVNRIGNRLRIAHLSQALKPALALALVALMAAGVWFFALRGNPTNSEQANVNQSLPNQEPQSPSPQPHTNQPSSQQAANPSEQRQHSGTNGQKSNQREKNQPHQTANLIAADPRKINPEDADRLRTRGTQRPLVGLSINRIKTIAIQLSCDAAFCRQIKERVIQALSTSGRFVFTESLAGADGLLKMSDIREPKNEQQGSINVRLANRAGSILFPTNQGGSSAKYSGSSEEIGQKIIKDLLKESSNFEKR